MIRDYDRHETELRETRETMDRLDGSLRRFAMGDIQTIIDQPFPLRLEGLRRDYNRGINTVNKAIDTIGESSQTMRSQANVLRSSLSAEETAQAARREKARQAAALAAGNERSARHQASLSQHVSAIAHNARADMDRPKDAIAAALKLITKMEKQADASNPLHQALKAKTEEISRELQAIGLYMDAIADHMGDLCRASDIHAAEATSLKAGVDEVARAPQFDLGPASTPMMSLADINRKLGDIDRETSRFAQVPVFAPPSPTDGDGNGNGRKPFLRLVKV